MKVKKIINVMWTIFWLFFIFSGLLIAIGTPRIPVLICMFVCSLLGIGIHIKTSEELI